MLDAIMLPVLIVTGSGILAGVMLALAAKFLSIPVDEKLAAVREALPGINCGACGFAGCDQYAKAIAEEGVAINRCIPGGDDAAHKIGALMGVDSASAQDVDEQIAFVACKGVPGDDTRKMLYKGIDTCYAASLLYGGDSACAYGCLGFGDCAKACPFGAIEVVGKVAVVKPEVCTGCSICVATCPKHLISLHSAVKPVHVRCSNKDKGAKTRKVCANGCIGCKKCVTVCPSAAITVENNLALIDSSKCTSCGKCIEACPVNVIERSHPSCEKN